jgi:hypothetical protein
MQQSIKAETRTYLAHLISEMLSIQDLPTDLREALTSHLHSQFNQVNLLKPEYCRRLYPILLELSELEEHLGQLVPEEASRLETPNGSFTVDDPIQDSF